MEEQKIDVNDVIKSLTGQIEDYSVRLAHGDAALKLKDRQLEDKDKRIKELELENKQLHEAKSSAE